MDSKKIYSLLGLSARAGKLKSGEFSVLDAIRSGKACAVIVNIIEEYAKNVIQ